MPHLRNIKWIVPLVVAYGAASGQEPVPADAFQSQVVPFFKAHCTKCHGDKEPEGDLSLSAYGESSRIQTDFDLWQRVLRMLAEREMPPRDEPRPKEEALQAAVAGIRAELLKFDCDAAKNPGRVTIRRLNRPEYNNTVRDLVGIDFQPADDFPSDDVGEGFDNIGDVLSIPPLLMEKYIAAAESIAARAMRDETARARIVLHTREQAGSTREATRKNLAAFATRAFRRPARDEEIDRLYDLVRLAREQGGSEDEALQAALTAVLANPNFLFRIERDPPADDEDGVRDLDSYELASRLSYFLWSTMPDEELFRLAAEGKLQQPDVLRQQAARMLQDDKARALTDNFAGQWLQLRSLADVHPDPEKFPAFNGDLRADMRRETEMFFETIVREDRSVLDFLSADYSFMNQRLARHYGIDGVDGEKFRRVKLNDQRRGVLTQGSILLVTSNPTRTSPVKRGKWVLDNILGEPPPDPPAGVGELAEDAETLGTLRERMEQHRADASCAVCHRKMDAIGFGLENFDVVGTWRDRDGRHDIDASGTLPGGRDFRGAADLMQILAEQKREEFCRCLAEKMLIYALGRGLEPYDRCTVNEIVAQLQKNDFRFSVLVASIVASEPFRMRALPQGNR